MIYDVVIIGAGASGLVCASYLKDSSNDKNVLLLEKNNVVGKKLSITGNGRCNLGNVSLLMKNYHSSSNFDNFKSILENNDYINYLEKIGILTTKLDDKIYPYSMQAISVCKSFERHLSEIGVDIKYNYEVFSLNKQDNLFIINNDIKSKNVVVATGGLSYPNTGSTGDGYDMLKYFNHKITDLNPSLVSLKTNYKYIKDIQGVRVNANAMLFVNDKKLKEEYGQVQFTKDSVSGICVFNLSRNVPLYLSQNKKVVIKIDLMSGYSDALKYISGFKNYKLQDALACMINNKIAQVISKEYKLFDKKVKDIDEKELISVVNKLHNFELKIIGVGDFKTAQITSGGASLDEFTNDLESKKTNGLYAIGEVLDIDADCGGFNLRWAFQSAIKVATYLSKK